MRGEVHFPYLWHYLASHLPSGCVRSDEGKCGNMIPLPPLSFPSSSFPSSPLTLTSSSAPSPLSTPLPIFSLSIFYLFFSFLFFTLTFSLFLFLTLLSFPFFSLLYYPNPSLFSFRLSFELPFTFFSSLSVFSRFLLLSSFV